MRKLFASTQALIGHLRDIRIQMCEGIGTRFQLSETRAGFLPETQYVLYFGSIFALEGLYRGHLLFEFVQESRVQIQTVNVMG